MLHYSKRLVPVPLTHERIGAGLGHPFSDLIFAKWGFNNVASCTFILISLQRHGRKNKKPGAYTVLARTRSHYTYPHPYI
jgi:hypothetical protein